MSWWKALSGFMGGPWGPLVAGVGMGLAGEMFSNDAKARRRARERMLYETDPSTIGRNAETFFGQLQNSPGMGMARSMAIGAGQTGAMATQRHLGQTGLGRSGIGAGQVGAVAAAPGMLMSKMTADAWDRAFQMANQNAQWRSQLQGQFEQGGMSRPLWGAAINAMGGYYSQVLANKTRDMQKSVAPQTEHEIDQTNQGVWEDEWNQRHPYQVPWWQQQGQWGVPQQQAQYYRGPF